MLKYKKCPDCGYENAQDRVVCDICGRDISREIVIVRKGRNILWLIILIALSFVGLCLYNFRQKGVEENDFLIVEEKESLNIPAIKMSLYGLSKLKIPDEKEEELVFKSLKNSDIEVKVLALNALLMWSCNCPLKKSFYFNKLVSLVKSGIPDFDKVFKKSSDFFEKEFNLSKNPHRRKKNISIYQENTICIRQSIAAIEKAIKIKALDGEAER